jgi:hypothetical protein
MGIIPKANWRLLLLFFFKSTLTLFSKPMLQRLQSECSNQYKANTYHYINYQDYGCTLNSNYGKKMFKRYIQMIQILTEV